MTDSPRLISSLVALLAVASAACGSSEPHAVCASSAPNAPCVELPPSPTAAPIREDPPAPASNEPPPIEEAPADEDAMRAAFMPLRDPQAPRPRVVGTLEAEVRALEQRRTSGPQPPPPDLLRKLADALAELADAKALDGRADAAAALRDEAARRYQQLTAQHPTFCASPGGASARGCGDEVLYRTAHLHERRDRLDEARKAYLQLIQHYPQSRYVPHAYLAFGELFLREMASDPSKIELAKASYQQVLRYPLPENEVFGIALLRLGQIEQRRGDEKAARSIYQRLLSTQKKYPNELSLQATARFVPGWARR